MDEFNVKSAIGMWDVAREALARLSLAAVKTQTDRPEFSPHAAAPGGENLHGRSPSGRTENVPRSEIGRAAVLVLSGELGAGKTTFTQALAGVLGASGPVQSPTYVIMKKHTLSGAPWHTLVHIDAYRLKGVEDLGAIGWKELLADPANLVVVEWPERIDGALPEGTLWLRFSHETPETRHVRVG